MRCIAVTSIALLIGACQHVPPTIAHTHIGHAVTGFDGTPEDKGLLVVAEESANSALNLMDKAVAPGSGGERKQQLVEESVQVSTGGDYGVKNAVAHVESHVRFAAESEDASNNLRSSVGPFLEGATAIQKRCDLIALLAHDVRQSKDPEEIASLANQIQELSYSNVYGEDKNGDGARGGSPSEFGVTQLRSTIEEILAREDPAYQPVDQWYLFHLVRLPDCDNCWAWRKWADSSNRGY